MGGRRGSLDLLHAAASKTGFVERRDRLRFSRWLSDVSERHWRRTVEIPLQKTIPRRRRTPRHALRGMDALASLLRIDLRTGHVHLDSERTFVYEPRRLVAGKQSDAGADQGRYRRRAEFGIVQV